MLTAQKLYLLLTKDNGKPESAFTYSSCGYNAAVIADLMAAGRLELATGKHATLKVIDAGLIADPLLAAALQKLAGKDGKRLDSIIAMSSLCDMQLLVDSLAAAGIIEYGPRGFFGLGKPKTATANREAEAQIRAELKAAIHQQGAPVADSLQLLSILAGIDLLPGLLASEFAPMDKKQAKARAQQLRQASKLGQAAASAVSTLNTVVFNAV